MLVLILLLFTGGFSYSTGRAPDIRALNAIAGQIREAMLRGDYEGVLSYDMPELRHEHTLDLQNRKSDLYCYLVGRGCEGPVKYHSIASQFAMMKRPEFATKRLSKTTYALVFFDSARYPRTVVLGTAFLCKHANQDVPIWTFEWAEDHWKALHPVFDSETDSFCSSQ